jgi:hypothetical protein
MEWLFLAIGVLLIFAGVADVFFTVLHPDGFGFLSSRLYGTLFHSMRFLVRPVPRRLRALVLSLAAPLMIPAVIAVWMFLVLTGYAFVYYAGMNGEPSTSRARASGLLWARRCTRAGSRSLL